MRWYWARIIIGMVLPFILYPRDILIAFREHGFRFGLAYWSGALWLSIPLALAVLWAAHLFLR